MIDLEHNDSNLYNNVSSNRQYLNSSGNKEMNHK